MLLYAIGALCAISLLLLVQLAVQRRRTVRRLRSVLQDVAFDPASGLFGERAIDHRITSELKRADRFEEQVWISMWRLAVPDTGVARSVQEQLRFSETGFAMDDRRTIVVLQGDATVDRVADLVRRIAGSCGGVPVDVGVATFPDDGREPGALVEAARRRLAPLADRPAA